MHTQCFALNRRRRHSRRSRQSRLRAPPFLASLVHFRFSKRRRRRQNSAAVKQLPILPTGRPASPGCRIRGSTRLLASITWRNGENVWREEGKNQVKMKKQSHDFGKVLKKRLWYYISIPAFFQLPCLPDSGSSIPQANARLYYSERLFPPGWIL